MIDLKPYFDAVNTAEAEVQRVASDIDTLFRQGSEASQAEALAKKAELDAAQQKHADAVAMYEAMQKTNRPNDIAKNFVPVSNTVPEPADGSQPTVIKRQTYDALSLVDRANFIRSGGKIED